MKGGDKNRGGWGHWLVLLVVVLAGVSYWLGWWPGEHHLTVKKLYRQLASPLLRLLVYMGVGLLVGQAIESLGWAARLGSLAAPLLRWGHLRRECGASFTAAFFSGIMANTMLVTLWQEGKISRREMTLTYLLNSGLPVYLLHLPTTFFIILPLVKQAGLIYLGLTLSSALLRTAVYLIYGRMRLTAEADGAGSLAVPQEIKKEGLAQEIWRKFRQRFSRVILYTLPIFLFIFILNDGGFFKWLREVFASHVAVSFFPMEAASVVIFSVATEFTSGMAAAGAFLQAGTLTIQQTVLALVLGNIVATPIRAIRHQLPSHMGIFSPKLGTEYLLLSQGLRLVSLVLVTVPYALWG
ncbi:MAG: nucleoside recognition domain-containing protein [Thermodesulfobacteriota bacterium]